MSTAYTIFSSFLELYNESNKSKIVISKPVSKDGSVINTSLSTYKGPTGYISFNNNKNFGF